MRVVLDTNVVLSALVFRSGSLSWLRAEWLRRRFFPLGCRRTIQELVRALSYPKFDLTPEEIRSVLADYLPYVEIVRVREGGHTGLPRCQDTDDQMFLELAAEGEATVVVSGDRDLLALVGVSGFVVETPERFRIRLRGGPGLGLSAAPGSPRRLGRSPTPRRRPRASAPR